MLTKRMKICLAAGAVLGIVCIIGAQLRSGFSRDAGYLFAFWYNRLLMGIIIGLPIGKLGLLKVLGRGAFLGTVISFTFYSATGFNDLVGFLAGIGYGVIIEYVAEKYVA